MTNKVCRLGIRREQGFLYYVKRGGVWRIPRQSESGRRKAVKIADADGELDPGYVYFLDRAGDISRAKLDD